MLKRRPKTSFNKIQNPKLQKCNSTQTTYLIAIFCHSNFIWHNISVDLLLRIKQQLERNALFWTQLQLEFAPRVQMFRANLLDAYIAIGQFLIKSIKSRHVKLVCY